MCHPATSEPDEPRVWPLAAPVLYWPSTYASKPQLGRQEATMGVWHEDDTFWETMPMFGDDRWAAAPGEVELVTGLLGV